MPRLHLGAVYFILGLAAVGCSQAPPPPPAAIPAPQIVPAKGSGGWQNLSGVGDFGSADYGQLRTVTFEVRNDSRAPRRLHLLDKSCACALVELPPEETGPGQVARVRLGWKPEVKPAATATADAARVWAVVGNDGDTDGVKLEATGRVQPSATIHLPRGELDFGSVEVSDLRAGRHETVFEITTLDPARRGFALSARTSHPGLGVAAVEPLPDERLRELGAVAGYRVTVRAGSGLPIGPFRERLTLQCPMYPAGLELPLTGQVAGGAVSVEPAEFNLAAARLSLSSGYRAAPVTVRLRYEPNRTLSVKAVHPSFFVVEAKPIQENHWELHLRLPAGLTTLSQQLDPQRWQEYQTIGITDGYVLCETDHPLVPAVRIPLLAGRLVK
jgi:hypothetical protein